MYVAADGSTPFRFDLFAPVQTQKTASTALLARIAHDVAETKLTCKATTWLAVSSPCPQLVRKKRHGPLALWDMGADTKLMQ